MNAPTFSDSASSAAERFSKASSHYAEHARIQLEIAMDFHRWYSALIPSSFAPEDCLDVGCGTGFITDLLLLDYPGRRIHAIDIAPGMLEQVRGKNNCEFLHTWELDGTCLHRINHSFSRESLLVSSMCAQWFSDPEKTVRDWLDVSRYIAVSVMTDGSLREWRKAHELTGQHCGLRPLPHFNDLLNTLLEMRQEGIIDDLQFAEKNFADIHPDGLSFVKSLRAIGADQPHPDHHPIQLRTVLKHLGKPCIMNYEVGYFLLRRA